MLLKKSFKGLRIYYQQGALNDLSSHQIQREVLGSIVFAKQILNALVRCKKIKMLIYNPFRYESLARWCLRR